MFFLGTAPSAVPVDQSKDRANKIERRQSDRHSGSGAAEHEKTKTRLKQFAGLFGNLFHSYGSMHVETHRRVRLLGRAHVVEE
jgi:hypothetical protein